MTVDLDQNNDPPNFPLKREKRNVYIGNRRTTLSFEYYVWEALEETSRYESQSIDMICSEIVANYTGRENISTVIRYLVLEATRLRMEAEIEARQKGGLQENSIPFPSPLYAALAKLNHPHQADSGAKRLPAAGPTQQPPKANGTRLHR